MTGYEKTQPYKKNKGRAGICEQEIQKIPDI
jgi:hypothetical protein